MGGKTKHTLLYECNSMTHLKSEHTSEYKAAVKGGIDGIFGRGISGWVLRPSDPDQRVWVELTAEGVSLGVGRAEHFHPAAASFGDGCYGFWIPVPPVVLSVSPILEVRVANTGETIAPPLELDQTGSRATELSRVITDGGLRLSGWAVNPDEPRKSLEVTAKMDNKVLASTRADQRRFHPDKSDGHGFTLTLPPALADGHPHMVDVLDQNNRPLKGSPVRILTLAEKASDWIQHLQFSEQNRTLLKKVLQQYEARTPGSLGFGLYQEWKKSFPLNTKGVKTDRIAVCPPDAGTAQLMRLASSNQSVLLMTEGTEILPRALGQMARAAREHQAALVYGDEELHNASDRVLPLFKPAWDSFLFLGIDYLGPVLVDSQIIKNLDTYPEEPPLCIRSRLIMAAGENRICHLPLPVSQSSPETSAYASENTSTHAHSDQYRRTLQATAFARQTGVEIIPHPRYPHLNRLRFPLTKRPLVSIIIPTRDRADLLENCLTSLWRSTAYDAVEILIIDNCSADQSTFDLFRRAKEKGAQIVSYPHAFNYAAMNNHTARQARGEVLCFLNNDTEIISPEWLEEMVSLLLVPGSGCVGAKLLWPNDLVQHGGVVVGTHQLAAHIGNAWTADAPGYMFCNQLTRQWSAVTAACLVTWKSLFLDNRGFDAIRYPVAFNDVDFCLRLREQGHKILWTPWSCLYHHESASRGKDLTAPQQARNAMELHNFRTQWGHFDDPFYNPNLTLSSLTEPFDGLALPPRNRKIRP
jgi:O-antigen biosynthesis protein